MPEPNADLRCDGFDVVVFALNVGNRERKVVDDNQDPVADIHVAPKLNVVLLPSIEVCHADFAEIAAVVIEIEADKTGQQTLCRVLAAESESHG